MATANLLFKEFFVTVKGKAYESALRHRPATPGLVNKIKSAFMNLCNDILQKYTTCPHLLFTTLRDKTEVIKLGSGFASYRNWIWSWLQCFFLLWDHLKIIYDFTISFCLKNLIFKEPDSVVPKYGTHSLETSSKNN